MGSNPRRNLYVCVSAFLSVFVFACVGQGRLEHFRVPLKNIFPAPPPPIEGRSVKNLYTTSGKLIFRCRVTWASSERVNFYIRQIMLLQRKTKTYATYLGPCPPSRLPNPGNFYRLFPPLYITVVG
jgi:hypothetical protein